MGLRTPWVGRVRGKDLVRQPGAGGGWLARGACVALGACGLWLGSCGGTFAAEGVGAVLEQAARQKAEALERYAMEHPNAEDLLKAWLEATQAWEEAGDRPARAGAVERVWEMVVRDEEVELRGTFVVGKSFFEATLEKGDRAKAKEVLAVVRSALEARVVKMPAEAREKAGEEVRGAMEQLEGTLRQPVAGETVELKFKGIDGRAVDLANLKGRVVLVDFWATWCGPCVEEMPNVKALYDEFHAKGFDILGVSLDEDRGKLTKFLAEAKIPWPQAFDGKGWGNQWAKRFGITGIPATFLVGREGKVTAVGLRGEELREAVAREIGGAADALGGGADQRVASGTQ